MSRPVALSKRPQLALQSYLDGLLQEATEDAISSVSAEEFQAAVQEERLRDTHTPAASVIPVAAPVALLKPVILAPPVMPVEVAPVIEEPAAVEAEAPAALQVPPPVSFEARPAWSDEPFECLLFDVAGLTLAVPLVSLGTIHSLEGQELTPLFGQPSWFLGLLPGQGNSLKVLDTARWVMPERYRDDLREGLQYVISVEGYDWGLAVHQVSRSVRLDPADVKWRVSRGQRPWLAGTVIEHMCALLDVAALAQLVVAGGRS